MACHSAFGQPLTGEDIKEKTEKAEGRGEEHVSPVAVGKTPLERIGKDPGDPIESL